MGTGKDGGWPRDRDVGRPSGSEETPLIVDTPPRDESVEAGEDALTLPPPPPIAGEAAGESPSGLKGHLGEVLSRISAIELRVDGVQEAIDSAVRKFSDDVVELTDDRLKTLKKVVDAEHAQAISDVHGEIAEGVESAVGRAQGDIEKAREDLTREIATLRTDVGNKASRADVDDISRSVGDLKGAVAGVQSSIGGLQESDKARAEALAALGRKVANLGGTIHTLDECVGAVEGAAENARRELEALRQSNMNIRAELENLHIHVRAIGRDAGELKGTVGGLVEALKDVRATATAAQTSADTARTEMAGLIPRLEHIEGLAGDMRQVRNLVEQVRALEGWRERFLGDLMEIAVATGRTELVAELAKVDS